MLNEFCGEDVFGVRDVIARYEEIEQEIEDENLENQEEFEELETLLKELAGNGGDEKWRDEWYPVTMIKDDYFEDYCQELLEDIGDIPRDFPHYIVIDWGKTCENIQQDYSEVEFGDYTYLYR